MSFFSRVFRSKDANLKKAAKKNGVAPAEPTKPQWTDAWLRTEVNPEEVQELIRGCTGELKARALDVPFLLLPFRPSSDPSAARTFIRNYFSPSPERNGPLRGKSLLQELRLTEPMVLCSVMKWCWSRLAGGVVTWEAYELFKVGEQDSQLARDAFSTFIPISVDSDARTKIIFDFFDLLAAIAAHGKSNGLGGRKLSRYAGWWAFEHSDTGKGFETSYKTWANAADATSHLFFAYLRSQSPDSLRGTNGISSLPISLQSLVQATEYPPERPSLLRTETTKVVMIVNTVSPTPFALLRRARNFQYRESDHALQKFSSYEDPVRALTDECRRVLHCISTINQSDVSTSTVSTSLRDQASWSRFEDIGFGGAIEESEAENDAEFSSNKSTRLLSLRSAPQSGSAEFGRPATPSWADFLSSGFPDENGNKPRSPFLLPPDKVLPPIQTARGQSSQSHRRSFDQESNLDPGELANISTLDLDDSFWWVWISSLSGEEPVSRKAVFGRCALLETAIPGGKWLVLEEQVKGAAPEPDIGTYVAEKKSFFRFKTRKGRLTRNKSSAKKITHVGEQYKNVNSTVPSSKTSVGQDQHARIQAAAAALQRKRREQEQEEREESNRAASNPENSKSTKTNSVLTMQPAVISEASQAMKWANNYDKSTVRAAYLGNSRAGTGAPADTLDLKMNGRDSPDEAPTDINRDQPEGSAQDKAPSPAPTPQSPEIAKSSPLDKSRPEPEPAPIHQNQSGESKPPEYDQMLGKKSSESTDDRRKLKKKPGNTGLKGMIGKKIPEPVTKPLKDNKISAVAAARAALEGRTSQATQSSTNPSSVKASASISRRRKKEKEDDVSSAVPKPVTPPKAEEQKPPVNPAPVSPVAEYDGPPRTHTDAEYETLSRVNTNEQAQADREFSSFDQPALVPPADTPTAETFPETSSSSPPDTSLPTAKPDGNKTAKSQEQGDAASDATEQGPPYQDRWAQIRKNAAERAALSDDVPESKSLQKRSEPSSSQQETIEMRAARIKARVAELTKNMENSR